MIKTSQTHPSREPHSLDQKLLEFHEKIDELADIQNVGEGRAAAGHLSTPVARLHQLEGVHHEVDHLKLEPLHVLDRSEEDIHELEKLAAVHRLDPLAAERGHHHQGQYLREHQEGN